MKRTSVLVLAMAAVLMVGAAFTASAVQVGANVPVTKALVDFFSAHGVDATYLGAPVASIPVDQLARINAIVNVVNDTTITTDDHDVLNTLVSAALDAAPNTQDTLGYLTLGSTVWHRELGLKADTAWIVLY